MNTLTLSVCCSALPHAAPHARSAPPPSCQPVAGLFEKEYRNVAFFFGFIVRCDWNIARLGFCLQALLVIEDWE